MDYKALIIELLSKIEDNNILRVIYIFILQFVNEES